MTLTELRYVVALAQEKHFGKAAKACHVSQPTLSVAIMKLESKLGVSIFERYRDDIRITEIGEKIIAQAKRVLEASLVIREIVDNGKSQLDSPLRIGGVYTVAPYLFPALIPKLKKHAPKMPLLIQEDFTAHLRMKLNRGELDAIFVSLPFTESGVVTRALYEEPFVVLMQKNHALAKQKFVQSSDLAREKVLLLGDGHCLRDQIIARCPQCYHPSDIQQTVAGTSLETLRHMVASGLGITILPSSATQVKHYGASLCVKPFKGKIPKRTVALAWRVSFPRTKAIDTLIRALADCQLDKMCLTSFL